jgi:hypothetical protein
MHPSKPYIMHTCPLTFHYMALTFVLHEDQKVSPVSTVNISFILTNSLIQAMVMG